RLTSHKCGQGEEAGAADAAFVRTPAALVVLAVVMLIAACTSVDYDFASVAPGPAPSAPASSSAPQAVVKVSNPRFGDRKPHPWDGRAPWTYPVHGTDVSKYQRDVDWAAARDAGIAFVFIKATE